MLPTASRPALRAIHALILREMATSQGRAAGGYLWAVAEPVAALALLTAIMALAFPAPPLGQDFALFYASGYLPFMLYGDLAQKTATALRFSRPLLAYPAVSWADALIARALLAVLTHAVVIGIVLAGIAALAATPLPAPDLPALALGGTLTVALGLGVGTLNACLFARFPSWERIWSVLNRPLFLISGVLFLPEAVPDPYRDWLMLNPLAHVIALWRAGIYGGYAPQGVMPVAVALLAGALLAAGLAWLGRAGREGWG